MIKAGSKSGYTCSKYIKLIISNLLLLAVLFFMVYAQKLAIEGAGLLLLFWVLINPIFVMAISSKITLSGKLHYNETNQYLSTTFVFLGGLALLGVGVVSAGQGKQNDLWSFILELLPLPPILLFQVIESSFLYRLSELQSY